MKTVISNPTAVYVASLVLGVVAFLGFAIAHASGAAALGYAIVALVASAGVTFAAAKTNVSFATRTRHRA